MKAVLDASDIIAARETIRDTRVLDEVIKYVTRLLHATRQEDGLSVGASPRSGLMLLMAAKSLARFAGRDYVTPDDVKESFIPVMRHRVVVSPHAELEGIASDEVLSNVMESVEVPR